MLPKDGSWSLVLHARGTGEVTPLPETVSVPVIRIGESRADLTAPDQALLRVANPADLLLHSSGDTINFGFLQSTNTQKMLFLTPAFAGQATDTLPGKLLSKRLRCSLTPIGYRFKGSLPQYRRRRKRIRIGYRAHEEFRRQRLQDGGKQVLELMHISSADGISRTERTAISWPMRSTGSIPRRPMASDRRGLSSRYTWNTARRTTNGNKNKPHERKRERRAHSTTTSTRLRRRRPTVGKADSTISRWSSISGRSRSC